MADINERHHEDKYHLEMMWNRFAELREKTTDDEHHVPPALYLLVDHTLSKVLNVNTVDIRSQEDYDVLAMYGDLMFHFGQFSALNGLYRSNLEPCNCLAVTDDQIRAFFDGVNFGKGSKDA